MNAPRSYPDPLLDEISRRVYYTAIEKVERELKKESLDTEAVTALADAAAAASSRIIDQGSDDDDDGDNF